MSPHPRISPYAETSPFLRQERDLQNQFPPPVVSSSCRSWWGFSGCTALQTTTCLLGRQEAFLGSLSMRWDPAAKVGWGALVTSWKSSPPPFLLPMEEDHIAHSKY